MDPQRLDSLVELPSASATRRGIVRLLAVLPLGVILAAILGQGEVDAELPIDRVLRRAHHHQLRQARHRRRQRRVRHRRRQRRAHRHVPGQHKDNPT
jgi:hypothetical protein